MKRSAFVCVFLLHALISVAQLRIATGYNYMLASGWDRAIQTYNFARPELTNKQPLLIHGLDFTIDYLKKSKKTFSHGFMAGYRYFRSHADNENFDVALNAHLINIGYGLHTSFPTSKESSRLTVDVNLSVVCGGIYRNVNGEPLRDDEKRIWAPGIGGELRPRIGYDLLTWNTILFSPYVQATYCPFYFSPRAEALLNQTIGLTGPKYTGILSLEVGVCVSLHATEPASD